MKRLNYVFVGFIFLGLFYLGFKIFQPFLITILLAIVLASVTYPLYQYILKKTNEREILASVLCCLLVFVLILLPLVLLSAAIITNSVEAYQTFAIKVDKGHLDTILNTQFLERIEKWIAGSFPFLSPDSIDLRGAAIAALKGFGKILINSSAMILSNIGVFIGNFFLLIFVLFFLYKDGKSILIRLGHLSPLPSSVEERIYQKFFQFSKSVVLGVFLTAVIHGVVGSIAFAIFGLSPFLIGMLLAFSSIIPVVGTAVVWIPIGLGLMLTGFTGWAVFLMIWCLVAMIIIDNFVKPLLISGKEGLHPLLVFFSILGGIQFFGIAGIIFGPLLISIFVLALDLYEEKYHRALTKMDKS